MQDLGHGTDRRVVLSAVWIFVVLNYIYADIFIILGGHGASTPEEEELVKTLSSPGIFVFFAFYLQMAMAMIVVSRLLKHGINRWSNILIASLHVLGGLGSLFVVTNTIYYIYYVSVEIIALLFIIWYAWGWKDLSEIPGRID